MKSLCGGFFIPDDFCDYIGMDWLLRHRLVASLGLILVVALVCWRLLPDHSPPPVTATRPVETTSRPVVEAPSADVPVVSAPDPSPNASVGVLRGRAFDAMTNEPVREFEITWREPIGEPRHQFDLRRRMFEATDGRFEYADVPPGRWGIIVSARGYQRFELPELKIAGGAALEVSLPLQKGHTLRGRVYDQTSGAGIAASLEVLDPLTSMVFRSSGQGTERHSSEQGSFVIEGLPPGRTALAVEAKNYTSRTVVVDVGASTPPLEIGLSAGATINGRFTTAAGNPIAAGSVTLRRLDGGLAGSSTTDAAGTFVLRDLDIGKYQLAGRSGSAIVTQEVILSGGTTDVQLTLESGRTIRGTVMGVRSDLLDRVNITVRRNGRLLWTRNGVNDHGEFELNDVAPGALIVTADVNRTREMSKSIEMPADADVTVNFDFPLAAALSGRVTRNNKALPGLPVIVQPPVARQSSGSHHTQTSSTGSYSLQDLEPGEYVVIVGSFISKPLQVQGQAVFDIDMSGGDLAGRVLDDSTGVPLAGASVDLLFADASVSPLRINRLTDHLGQFNITGVVPTEYLLTVYRPGYRLYRERISFDAQGAAPTIRLRQDKGVEIRGRDAATGNPVREIMVIEAGQGGFVITLPLDEDGVGYLPSGLAGSKLQLVAPGVGYTQIPSWNGSALDVRFGT